jgi:hypothetical protein
MELGQLCTAGMKPTSGDIRCIVYGHLTRMGIWNLRKTWDTGAPTSQRLARFAQALTAICKPQVVIDSLVCMADQGATRVAESTSSYGNEDQIAVPF